MFYIFRSYARSLAPAMTAPRPYLSRNLIASFDACSPTGQLRFPQTCPNSSLLAFPFFFFFFVAKFPVVAGRSCGFSLRRFFNKLGCEPGCPPSIIDDFYLPSLLHTIDIFLSSFLSSVPRRVRARRTRVTRTPPSPRAD